MQTFPRYLVDVNGDGLPDIVGIHNACLYVSINTGTSFPSPGCWLGGGAFAPSTGWTDTNTFPRFVQDPTGDGFPGIIGIHNSGLFVALNKASGPPPDQISSFTNGLGTTIVVTYKPLTASGVHTKDTGDKLPIVDVQAPIYVVTRVDNSNGVGGTYSSTYSYAGAKADLSGRGFLGFRQMMVNDVQTNITNTTTYRQDFPYTGLAASTVRSFGSQTISRSANTYQFTNWPGTATIDQFSAPYQVSLQQNVSSGADLDGSTLPTMTTANQYDALGNPTQIVVSTSDGFSKTTANTYNNDTFNWHLGQLTRSGVTGVAP